MHELKARLQLAVARPPVRVPMPESGRRASVCAIFSGDLELLLVRRADYAGDPWSGHVALPGGRVEEGETPLEAAIRETWEEVGLQLAPADVLGELDELRTMGPLPPLVIRPYVFWVEALGDLDLNGEVASAHQVSLRFLLSDEGRGVMTHPWRGTDITLPKVDFAEQRLWGLTLHMVDDLLNRLDGRGRGLVRLDAPPIATPWDR